MPQIDKEAEFQRDYNKYLVLKWDDIIAYLQEHREWKGHFSLILDGIEARRKRMGKKPNTYVVVNEDEPYAEDVWMLIEKGKSLKELNYRKIDLDNPPEVMSDGEIEKKRASLTGASSSLELYRGRAIAQASQADTLRKLLER